MNDGLRLLAAVSSHGYGHLAQTAPVLNALGASGRNIELTLRTGLARDKLDSRLHLPFRHDCVADDFGMMNRSALEVDVSASEEKYRHFHADWETRVRRVADSLAAGGFDLVVADVPYLTLAAAKLAGIPAIALCSLNWADIYGHYCGHTRQGAIIREQMLAAYETAAIFLRPEPSMPMSALGNTRAIGPIAAKGRNCRQQLDAAHGWPQKDRLVLVAMGGIGFRPPMEQWPFVPGVRWVVQADWKIRRGDCVSLEALGISYLDALASCDLLVTKPGYGSFTEAAVCGIPVLYVTRDDWPEAQCLSEWLEVRGCCARLTQEEFIEGDFLRQMIGLLDGGTCVPVESSGIADALCYLEPWLD